MKKLMLILVILSLIGCTSPVDEPVVLTFEEAVQEVYEMTGRTLFYSSDGITMDKDVLNRVSSPNEIPGVCTDYAIEFAYYWNEVKNYDEVYGKAYFAWVNRPTFYIADVNFAPNGTSHIREQTGNFGQNATSQEMDGVYRDTTVISIVYSGRFNLHFGENTNNHMWVVINIEDDWYDTEPTWWDCTRWDNVYNNYAPRKITF
jgi:hypothetical protein